MNKKVLVIIIGLCISALIGCQKKSNKSNINIKDIGISDKGIDKEDSEDKEDMIENNSNIGKNADKSSFDITKRYEFVPTIENPEQFFEKLELAPAYKAIGYHNPIMSQRFGADPYALAYGDRLYVYMTNDSQQLSFDNEGKGIENTYEKIRSLNCISTEDMVNWTDHGIIPVGKPDGATWWANNSWAPAAAHKEINGKDQFFLYFANSGGGIGVLQSDSPTGPFKDPIGKPLISKETENCSNVLWLFDPAVLVDDDGRSYIYFGGGVPDGKQEMPNTARMVELGADMISLVGVPQVIEAPFIFEDSGINKIGDTYYYSYCSNWSTRDNAVGPHVPAIAEIIYMTSKNPLGPWEYQGPILQNPGKFFGTWGNNHHCMVEFKGKWYMLYHTQLLQDNMGIQGGYRSTHIDEVTINKDGSIEQIGASKFGVKQLLNLDPYKRIEAETMAWMGGISSMEVEESSGSFGITNNVVTEIQSGDWIGISKADFGNDAPKEFIAKVSSNTSGNIIKITVDSLQGECLGYLEIPDTGDTGNYAEVAVDINGVTGVHNLFFTFYGKGFQFDAWSFSK